MESKLRKSIYTALKNITDNAPKIKEAISTELGYRNIEDIMIRMVINEGITPAGCIPHIEMTL